MKKFQVFIFGVVAVTGLFLTIYAYSQSEGRGKARMFQSQAQDLDQPEGEGLRQAVINRFLTGGINFSFKDQVEFLIKYYDHIENTLVSLLDDESYARGAARLLLVLGGDKELDEIFKRIKSVGKRTDIFGEDYFEDNLGGLICDSLAAPQSDEQWNLVDQCPCMARHCPLAASDDPRSFAYLESAQKAELDRLNSLILKYKEEPTEHSVTEKGYHVVSISNGTYYRIRMDATKRNFNWIMKAKKEYPEKVLSSPFIDGAFFNVYPLFLRDKEDSEKVDYFIQYNNQEDVALVNVTVQWGRPYGYNLVFTKKDEMWSLKAIFYKPSYDNSPGPEYGEQYK
jgi:hypothetical protein